MLIKHYPLCFAILVFHIPLLWTMRVSKFMDSSGKGWQSQVLLWNRLSLTHLGKMLPKGASENWRRLLPGRSRRRTVRMCYGTIALNCKPTYDHTLQNVRCQLPRHVVAQSSSAINQILTCLSAHDITDLTLEDILLQGKRGLLVRQFLASRNRHPATLSLDIMPTASLLKTVLHQPAWRIAFPFEIWQYRFHARNP